MKITPYFLFNGQAEQAAGFYADLLQGKVENLCRYAQWPDGPGKPQVPEEYQDKVMHCCVMFAGGAISMADALPSAPSTFGNGGHVLALVCDSVAQAETAYEKLCDGAQDIKCALCETFYAKRYAEVVDQFGILWSVMFEE